MDKYVKLFRESLKKLEEDLPTVVRGEDGKPLKNKNGKTIYDFRNTDWDMIPPKYEFTDKEKEAMKKFDELVNRYMDGLETRKDTAMKITMIANDLPEWEWLKNKEDLLPTELFPTNKED